MNNNKSTFIGHFIPKPGADIKTVTAICDQLVERTIQEPGCQYYGYSMSDDNRITFVEYVDDPAAAIYHIENIADILEDFFKVVTMESLTIITPEHDVEGMKQAMAAYNPSIQTISRQYVRNQGSARAA